MPIPSINNLPKCNDHHQTQRSVNIVQLHRWRNKVYSQALDSLKGELVEFPRLLKIINQGIINEGLSLEAQSMAWSFVLDWLVDGCTSFHIQEIFAEEIDFCRDILQFVEDSTLRITATYNIPNTMTNFLIAKTKVGVRREFVRRKSKKIFAYILDFPATRQKLFELYEAAASDFYTLLSRELVRQYRSQVLTVALSTEDIVLQMVVALDPLRLLDPTGYLIHQLRQEFKAYLRLRGDYRQSIVSTILKLMDDKDFEQEFSAMDCINFDGVDADMFSTLPNHWHGDPVLEGGKIAIIPFSCKCGNAFDVLVNIFDAPDEFVETFMELLAVRLLDCPKDLTRLVSTVEKLRHKIHSPMWTSIDVMLHDYEKSLEFHSATLKFIICSHRYWPASTIGQPGEEEQEDNNNDTRINDGDDGRQISNISHLVEHQPSQYQNFLIKFAEMHPKMIPHLCHNKACFKITLEFDNGQFSFIADVAQKNVLYKVDEANDPIPLDDNVEAIQHWIRLRVLERNQRGLYKIVDTYNANQKPLAD